MVIVPSKMGRLNKRALVDCLQIMGTASRASLAKSIGLSQPTVSHHLKVLRDAGLVEREQRGSWAYFRVVPDQLKALRELLT